MVFDEAKHNNPSNFDFTVFVGVLEALVSSKYQWLKKVGNRMLQLSIFEKI